MLWAALLLPLGPDSTPPSSDALQGLGTWALQFTTRVAVVDEAVVMAVEASTRLFRGKRALRDRVVQEAADLGARSVAWAPTSLAAIAVARVGKENGFRKPISELLDELPMETLRATSKHLTTLTQLGCRTLGDVRKLPRSGVSRRFDKELLGAMDQAYGPRPEAHRLLSHSDFDTTLEDLPGPPAVRLGLRQVSGCKQASAERLMAARAQTPFDSSDETPTPVE